MWLEVVLLVSSENTSIILEVLQGSPKAELQVDMSNSWETGFESEQLCSA